MSLSLNKAEWTRATFGDVVGNSNDKVRDPEAESIDRVIAMEHLDPRELKISRWGELESGTSFTRRVRPGQTLFGKRRAYQRKAAVAEFDAITSGDILVFDADESQLLPEFLPFLVQSNGFYRHALGTSAGSLSPRTNWRDLADYEFSLPSLEEQRRLADLLWAVERHRRGIESVAEAVACVLTTARLALLVTGSCKSARITPDAVHHWTQSVPNGWSSATIGSVASLRSGATPSRSENARYFEEGTVPWVKTLDLNEGVLATTDECITEVAVAETSAKLVPSGTILVAMYGGFAQIGRTACLGMDAATNQAITSIQELSDRVMPEFLHEVLKAGRPRWRRVAASTRKDPNITKRDIEQFEFPLPPRQAQSRILEELSTVRRATDRLVSERAGLRNLTHSILEEVFGAPD